MSTYITHFAGHGLLATCTLLLPRELLSVPCMSLSVPCMSTYITHFPGIGLLATCTLLLPRELLRVPCMSTRITHFPGIGLLATCIQLCLMSCSVCLACPRTSHIPWHLACLQLASSLCCSVFLVHARRASHHTFCCLACTLHMLPRDRLACAHRVSRVARWPMQLGQRALLSRPALSRCVVMRHCEWQQ
jgi:hypothetical protein